MTRTKYVYYYDTDTQPNIQQITKMNACEKK